MPMLDKLDSLWERRLYRLRQDLSVMRRLFPWRTTAILIVTIAVMAHLFQSIYVHDLDEPLTYVQAVYAVLNMIFFQLAYTDLPADDNLTPFFVLAPIVGLSLFSLTGFNILQLIRVFFVRRERGQRWQEALAATYYDHVVVCGLGSIGYRIARYLAESDQPVVGIELDRTDFTDQLVDADLPVILGDVRARDVLEKAGVTRATTVIVCTNHDMANIEAAFHVRELNPRARLVLRIFEDEIAHSVMAMSEAGFQIDAVLSRSAIAAVAFAHAAVGVEVLESFQLDDLNYILARVPLRSGSPLVGCTVDEVARDRDATIAFLCQGGRLVNEPLPDTQLEAGDDLYVFTAVDRLTALVHRGFQSSGRDEAAAQERPIIVCGLGHVGYRIANILRTMGYAVVGLERQASRLGQRLARQDVTVQIVDFRRRTALREVGIEHAQAIVICTQDAMLNLETSLRARELAPEIRVVMRLFEEELGRRLSRVFGIDAVLSTSALAVPAFVAAALNLYLPQAVTIGDETLALARLTIEPRSDLVGQTIHQLNAVDPLTVVLHARHNRIDVPPRPEKSLCVEDENLVLISPEQLRRLSRLNRSPGPRRRAWL